VKVDYEPHLPRFATDLIRPQHVSEAINYRTLDRSLWT